MHPRLLCSGEPKANQIPFVSSRKSSAAVARNQARHTEDPMTRDRTYHLVLRRLHRLLTTMLTLVGMAILFIAGCDPATAMLPDEEEGGYSSEEDVNEGDEFDPYVLAIKFWEDDIYQNEEIFADFVYEIEGLSMEQTELLIMAVDDIAASMSTSSSRLSENIHVYWSSWPSARYPNSVYVTTACGGDYDVGCRYNNVPNAYSNPGALWFETNSSVVY